ncbi:MAG: RNA 2',3'-cyclic phosphodiesterase [Acidipropionibacterium sp.]|nr:RNA 2',3'-cyclic phosphodiesterase [Acidipropionibacterium sp.]
MGSRMYLALVPPTEVLESIDELVERMRERSQLRDPRRQDPRRLRWIQPGDAHITLAFMASVSDPEGLADALTADLDTVVPVSIGLSGAGAFPDPVTAKVLWLGVSDPADALPTLARRVRSAAHGAGAQPEGGPFSPHLSVARCRPGDVTGEIDALSGFSAPAWRARSAILFESHVGSRGARHQPVAEIVLNGLDRSQFRSPK